MRSKRKPLKRAKHVRQCPGCVRLAVEAKTLEAVMEQREATYKRQMEIALGAILALKAEIKRLQTDEYGTSWRDVAEKWMKRAGDYKATQLEADKALASYVQSFDTFKSSLRAILDRERDGRLAPADVQELRSLVQ